MKFFYTINKNGLLFKPCPFKKSYKLTYRNETGLVKLGNLLCQKCFYHIDQNFKDRYVICSHPDFSNKLKIIKGLIK